MLTLSLKRAHREAGNVPFSLWVGPFPPCPGTIWAGNADAPRQRWVCRSHRPCLPGREPGSRERSIANGPPRTVAVAFSMALTIWGMSEVRLRALDSWNYVDHETLRYGEYRSSSRKRPDGRSPVRRPGVIDVAPGRFGRHVVRFPDVLAVHVPHGDRLGTISTMANPNASEST